jgi:hypothetical protein
MWAGPTGPCAQPSKASSLPQTPGRNSLPAQAHLARWGPRSAQQTFLRPIPRRRVRRAAGGHGRQRCDGRGRTAERGSRAHGGRGRMPASSSRCRGPPARGEVLDLLQVTTSDGIPPSSVHTSRAAQLVQIKVLSSCSLLYNI